MLQSSKNINNCCMPQCPFSHKTSFIDSATTYRHTRPSALLVNIKSLHDSEPIYLTNGDAVNASDIGKLPNP